MASQRKCPCFRCCIRWCPWQSGKTRSGPNRCSRNWRPARSPGWYHPCNFVHPNPTVGLRACLGRQNRGCAGISVDFFFVFSVFTLIWLNTMETFIFISKKNCPVPAHMQNAFHGWKNEGHEIEKFISLLDLNKNFYHRYRTVWRFVCNIERKFGFFLVFRRLPFFPNFSKPDSREKSREIRSCIPSGIRILRNPGIPPIINAMCEQSRHPPFIPPPLLNLIYSGAVIEEIIVHIHGANHRAVCRQFLRYARNCGGASL